MNINREINMEKALNDARMSYFKRGIVGKKEETLLNLVLVFAQRFFCDYHGEAKRSDVWKEIVQTEKLDGVRFEEINDPNQNQLVGMVQAARVAVEDPIYKLKSDYQTILPTKRLWSIIESKENVKSKGKNFPKIIVVPVMESNPSPYLLKKLIAEKAMEGLKKYLQRQEARTGKSTIALTGGTSTLRFMNKFLNELDEDPVFRENLGKIAPITVAEISDPKSLSSFGLLENNRSLHLALRDMKLADSKDYIKYHTKNKDFKKNFQAIYTGIGKPEESVSPASNSDLQDVLSDGKFPKDCKNFLFEINAIPYYESLNTQVKVRDALKPASYSLESLQSEHKIILCPGGDKARSVYNLIIYSIRNPNEMIASHIIMDNITYLSILKLAENTPGEEYSYAKKIN